MGVQVKKNTVACQFEICFRKTFTRRETDSIVLTFNSSTKCFGYERNENSFIVTRFTQPGMDYIYEICTVYYYHITSRTRAEIRVRIN